MTIQDLGALGELISALAVLGSLIYIATQVRQTNRQILINSDLQIRNSAVDAWTSISSNPENARVWHLGINSFSELNPEEVGHFYLMLISVFLVFEARYDHYSKGNLDEESWIRITRSINALLQSESVREWYRTRAAPIHKAEFVSEVEELMRSMEGDA